MSKEIVKKGKGELIPNKSSSKELLDMNTSALAAALDDIEIPRLFYQLVIFIIDGSDSMNSKSPAGCSKAEDIDKGLRLIIKRLQKSKNNNSFDICFIAFSDEYKNVFSLRGVNDIDLYQSFNPLSFVEPKGTKLNDALAHAHKVGLQYKEDNNGKNTQVLTLILSDGAINDYDLCEKKIEEMKSIPNFSISCQFLESEINDDQDWYSYNERTGEIDYSSKWSNEDVKASEKKASEKLKKFASSPEMFITSIDPEEIRKHMIKSISAISEINKSL